MIRPSLGRRSAPTGRSKRRALGAGRHLPGRRQPGARSHSGTQSGPGAQDCAQPHRPRPIQRGQCARQTQEGRLERRLHVPAPGRKLAVARIAAVIFMRRPCPSEEAVSRSQGEARPRMTLVSPARRMPTMKPVGKPDAGCDRRSRYELASASLVRPKLSKRDGSEFCGHRGNILSIYGSKARVRTLAAFRDLLLASGFEVSAVIPTRGSVTVIEAKPV